jgi:AcrR family transcriptional regulator
MTGNPSLREKKKTALREELSVTTVLLARERGLDNVRVEDIVERVGVSRRTFGNYFSSKEDAIADRHVQRVRSAAAELASRPASQPLWSAITGALLAPYETDEGEVPSREEQSGLLAVLSTPSMKSAVDRGAREANAVFAAAIAERLGVETDDQVANVISAAALSALLTTLESWASSGEPEPLPPLLCRAFDLLGTGFRALR